MLGHRALRAQPELFGAVPSDSTLYRTIRSIDPHTLAGVWEAAAGVRGQMWRRTSATTGAPVVLDLDASLVEIHSEHKEGTAATYKGGFGFAPMFCFADATGEALAAILRPGNATTNSIADQLAAVDAALAQLPGEIGIGHRPGDEASLVRRAVRVRADSAGCSPKLATALRDRNAGCRGGPHQRPGPSSDLPGHRRPSSVGTGAHPRWRGAPRRRGGRADRAHQPRRLAAAEPKTLRWELWRTPARVVRRSRRRILRVLDTWPTTWHLFGAYHRLALIT